MKVLLASLHHVEYALELAMALRKRHVVSLLLSEKRVEQTIGSQKLKKILIENNLEYTIIKKYPGKNIRVVKNLLSLIHLVLRFKPDIIHIQESGDIHYISLFLFRIPIVVTVHDVLPHFGTQFKYNALLKCVRRHIYKNVIVHGEMLKEQYLRYFNPKLRNLFSIPHGSLFSFKTGQVKTKEEKNTILFFGRMEKYKGLKFLLEASKMVDKEISDFKVIIAGEGGDLRKRKKDIINNNIFEIIDEFIPNDKVSILFKRSAVVVLPYIEASQSGVVAMAYAFTKPVIATNVGSIPEMVINGKTGIIIPPKNSKALKDAIVYLLGHDEIKNKFKNEIRKATKNQFCWNSISCLTEKAYHAVLFRKKKVTSVHRKKNLCYEKKNSLNIAVIKNSKDLLQIEDAWNTLVEKDDEATPFQTYLWNKIWWDSYGKENKLFIILLQFNNTPIAIFPFMVVNEKYLNITIRRVQFIGTGKSDYLSPILNIKPDLAWFHAFKILMENKQLWNIIELQRLPVGFKAFEGLTKYLTTNNSLQISRSDKHCQACPIVKINTEWKDFIRKNKSKKTIKKIKHKYHLLCNKGNLSFLMVKEKKGVEAILNKIADVENKSWKKNSETALFHTSEDYDFMLNVCSQFAEKGNLKILGLFLENRLITYRIGYLEKNKFYSYSTSYDPEYKKYSPGILLLKDTIQSCFSNNISEYNHGRGEENFKKQWSNSMNKFHRTMIFNNHIDSLFFYIVEKYFYPIAVNFKFNFMNQLNAYILRFKNF